MVTTSLRSDKQMLLVMHRLHYLYKRSSVTRNFIADDTMLEAFEPAVHIRTNDIVMYLGKSIFRYPRIDASWS